MFFIFLALFRALKNWSQARIGQNWSKCMYGNIYFHQIGQCGFQDFVTVSKCSSTQPGPISYYLKFCQILSIFPSFLASFDPEPKLFDQNSDRLGDAYLNVIQYYEIIQSSKIDSMHLYLTFSLFLLIFSYFCLENGQKWIRNQNWEGEGVFLRWFQTHDPRGKCIETYFFYLFHP